MPRREPLYPHIPKNKRPIYPHASISQEMSPKIIADLRSDNAPQFTDKRKGAWKNLLVFNSHECRVCIYGWQGIYPEPRDRQPPEVRGLGKQALEGTGKSFYGAVPDYWSRLYRVVKKHYKQYHPKLYEVYFDISQEKLPSTLTEPDLISLVKSWLDEWADRYKLPPIGAKASGKPGYIAFDHNHNTILIDYRFIETVKAHEQALSALKFAVAHEFGHYVSLKHHGLAWYLESLKDCTISEQEADIVAKQLTGLTGEEAFSILEKYEIDNIY